MVVRTVVGGCGGGGERSVDDLRSCRGFPCQERDMRRNFNSDVFSSLIGVYAQELSIVL